MKTTNKTYKIETMQDVVDATNGDNLDAFLADLKLVMLQCYLVRSVQGADKFGSWVWTDDGIEKGTVHLNKESSLSLEKIVD